MLCIQHTGSSTDWSTATFPISWNENKPCPRQALVFTSASLLKTVGEGEIAPHEQKLLLTSKFFFYHSVFFLENFSPFSLNFKLLSANHFSSEESKICPMGKG